MKQRVDMVGSDRCGGIVVMGFSGVGSFRGQFLGLRQRVVCM